MALVGDLLLVTYYYVDSKDVHFGFFKLDADGQLTWWKLQGIGDCTLFVTKAENVNITAAGDVYVYRRNCIYKASLIYGTSRSKVSLVYHVDAVSIEDNNMEQLSCHREGYRLGLVHAACVTPWLWLARYSKCFNLGKVCSSLYLYIWSSLII